MSGLDVIITSEFYQAFPIQNLWIFKSLNLVDLIFLESIFGMKT
jgi:hypothetical protein